MTAATSTIGPQTNETIVRTSPVGSISSTESSEQPGSDEPASPKVTDTQNGESGTDVSESSTNSMTTNYATAKSNSSMVTTNAGSMTTASVFSTVNHNWVKGDDGNATTVAFATTASDGFSSSSTTSFQSTYILTTSKQLVRNFACLNSSKREANFSPPLFFSVLLELTIKSIHVYESLSLTAHV